MTTLKLTPKEAIEKAKQLISEKRGFDFFSKNSQYVYCELDEDFYRVNLWSDNHSDYKNAKDFLNQLKRSSSSEKEITINIYLG